MATGRFSFLIILVLLGTCYPSSTYAGWWFAKQDPWQKSGLNLQQGYDQNTVITLSGTIVSIDTGAGNGPALAVVKTESETVSLVLGPRDFWEVQGIPLAVGDPVSVRGSKAKGRDGVVYLMVQTIAAVGNTHKSVLRSPAGRPAWSGGVRPMAPRPMPMRQMRGGKNH